MDRHMISRKRVEKVCALLALFASSTAALGNQFIALGDLPGGGFGSSALGVSANGRVVVGGSTADSQTGFIWTDATGMQALPGTHSAMGVSADGKTVVGGLFDRRIGEFGAYQAIAWDAEDGIQNLHAPLASWPDLPVTFGEATEASYDGKVIVGAAVDDGHYTAFRYTRTDGMERLINLDNVDSSNASDVSDDGQVVVGTLVFESGQYRAYRWNETEGASLLPGSPHGTPTESRAISADGKYVVGVLDTGQGYRWDETTGLVPVGLLPGYPNDSGATVVTGSGEAVLGIAEFGSVDARATPYLWTSQRGIVSLQEVLANEFGLDEQLQGWRLIQPLAISADGRSIAGLGSNPGGLTEAWLVRLDQPIFVPEPVSLAIVAIALGAAVSKVR